MDLKERIRALFDRLAKLQADLRDVRRMLVDNAKAIRAARSR